MKKRLLFSIVIISILSCSKELAEEPISANIDQHTIFTAEIVNPTTKTSLKKNGEIYNVIWSDTDSLTIMDNKGNTALYKVKAGGSTSAYFEYLSGNELAEGDGVEYTAYYPWTLAEGKIPSSIKFTEGDIADGAFPMIARSCNTQLNFSSLCGIARLNIKTSQISKVAVDSLKFIADKGLSGDVTIDVQAKTLTVNGSSGLLLDCSDYNSGNGVELSSSYTPFYAVLPAGEYSAMSFTINTVDGMAETISLKSGKTVEIEQSMITDISFSANEVVWDYSYGNANSINAYGKSSLLIDVAAHPIYSDCIVHTDVAANKATTPDGCKIIWCEEGFSLSSVELQGNNLAISGLDGTGNALVAITNGDDIIWSFHIWRPEINPDTNLLHYIVNKKSEFDVMPMALGARNKIVDAPNDNAKGTGCVYQWGRKDPFIVNPNFSLGSSTKRENVMTIANEVTSHIDQHLIEYAHRHPDAFMGYPAQPSSAVGGYNDYRDRHAWVDNNNLWGNPENTAQHNKSAYDPCPEGYKVCSTIYNQFTIGGGNCLIKAIDAWNVLLTTVGGELAPISGLGGYYMYYDGYRTDDPTPTNTDFYPNVNCLNYAGTAAGNVCYYSSYSTRQLRLRNDFIYPNHTTGDGWVQACPLRCVKE